MTDTDKRKKTRFALIELDGPYKHLVYQLQQAKPGSWFQLGYPKSKIVGDIPQSQGIVLVGATEGESSSFVPVILARIDHVEETPDYVAFTAFVENRFVGRRIKRPNKEALMFLLRDSQVEFVDGPPPGGGRIMVPAAGMPPGPPRRPMD